MPNRMPHSCATGGCRNAAPVGQAYCDVCAAKRTAADRTPSAVTKLYQTRRWKDPVNGVAILVRNKNPFCQYIHPETGIQCTQESKVVHHLVDPKDNARLFFDWANLVAVCTEHHQGGQRGETQGYHYCHTMGYGVEYSHGYAYPYWHEKYVPIQCSNGRAVLYTVSNASAEAIKKALAEPI